MSRPIKDLLERGEFISFLQNLIQNSAQYKRISDSDSYVIALDSSWGSGKTTLLDLFEQQSTNTITTIRYNAWKNDFWNNAFEPLMQTILLNEQFQNALDKDKIARIGKNILKSTYAVAKGLLTTPMRTVLGETASDEVIKNIENAGTTFISYINSDNSFFKEYQNFNKNITTLKTSLTEYVEQIPAEQKIIIVIDELDRCKPTFAIQTLEIVKHIFDVPNLTFLFALDIEQLSHSICCVYGQNMDATGYLYRFFDYIAKMPQPNIKPYIKESIKSIGLPHHSILNVYIENSSINFDDAISDFMVKLYTQFNFSLRDLDTFIQSYKILYNNLLKNYEMVGAHYIYLFFLAIKYKQPEVFNKIFIKTPKQKWYPATSNNEIFSNLQKDNPFISECITHIDSKTPITELILSGIYDETGVSPNSHQFNGLNILAFDATTKKIKYRIKQSNGNYKPSDFQEYALKKDKSFGNILFYYDLIKFEQIKNTTYNEYIHKQLEMYNFTSPTQKNSKD